MSTIVIKGTRIGSGRPKTIVSLMEPDVDCLLPRARQAVAGGAECLEWRADFSRDVHNTHAMAVASSKLCRSLPRTPVVFTFRSASQGGALELSRDAYDELVRQVAAYGHPDVVDIEDDGDDEHVQDLVTWVRTQGSHPLVSYHDFLTTPTTAWMVDKLVHMAELGASIPKLAVMAHQPADALRLMEATALAAQCIDRPLVTMAMGPHGVISRIAGEAVGSALTFCALETPSAPGQIQLSRAATLLDELHEVL